MELKIKDLEILSLKNDFWDDQDNAREILQKKTKLTESLDKWKKFNKEIRDIEHLWAIALQEKDEQVLQDLSLELDQLNSAVCQEEIKMMLASEQDPMNAIVSIHAGAGGTEAQDWAEMLLRMYLRWAEKKGFTTKIIDCLPGDEAGIKSVSFTVGRANTLMVMRKRKSAFIASFASLLLTPVPVVILRLLLFLFIRKLMMI